LFPQSGLILSALACSHSPGLSFQPWLVPTVRAYPFSHGLFLQTVLAYPFSPGLFPQSGLILSAMACFYKQSWLILSARACFYSPDLFFQPWSVPTVLAYPYYPGLFLFSWLINSALACSNCPCFVFSGLTCPPRLTYPFSPGLFLQFCLSFFSPHLFFLSWLIGTLQ
jgi:hypothetical protein